MDNQRHSVAEPCHTHRWRELQPHRYVKILVVGGLICYLFRIEISQIVGRWLTDANWSHGFLIPIFSLYFVNQKRDYILSLQTKPNYLGLLFLILAIGFYVLNRFSPSGYEYFCRISIVTTLASVVLLLGGWSLIAYTWLPIGFLLFAVPLPKGRVLEPALDVAEACSGMRLLMAFVALGVAMAYLHERALWQRIVLLVSTIPIAIFCNVVRVTITGFIYVLVDPKYAQGIYHDMLGMAMLPLAFGLYGFLAWLMSNLFMDESETIHRDVVICRRGA
jgi:exosortase/archaeosortase family protein